LPDLEPSDFSLFATVRRLEHASMTNDKKSFEELHTILTAIPGKELEILFEAWSDAFAM
jgi:hypothetical protein